ncbi:MAG: hypothetical protein BV458_09240, partial [Thermoplasmata archaeon M9B2D]
LTSNSFGVDFRILEDDMQSWVRLRSWLVLLNDSAIEYSITLTPNRSALVDVSAQTLATTELIEAIYREHRDALLYLTNTTLLAITHLPQSIAFDLTLSRHEWQMLMLETRSLDLIGFSSLMRTSIFSVSVDRIENEATLLHNDIVTSGIIGGILVEPFVIDDLQDADTTSMRVCGVTFATLGLWTHHSVLCQRSRFSFEMQGDVGEYLVHSYSSSISRLGEQWSMRMGNIGNSTDVSGRVDSVYESIDILVNDIALAAGNGVQALTLDSLPSLLNTFGATGLTQLRDSIDAVVLGSATYTFRIFAFRAVFMAIDAFDFLMF